MTAAPARAEAARPRVAWPWWLAAAGWAALIFYASSQPNPFPFVPRSIFGLDKLVHAGVYAVLGAFLRLAVGGAARGLAPRAALALAIGLAALYGASDEWHQAHVPNRSADPADWAADLAGAALGAAAATAFLRRKGNGA